ncbi:Ig-like domain-containing protein [Nocardioides baekrokdamisoli]|uniref:Ig-like domain-containing protein n=1 Tax=Nocardioides baekrokdamisoli TaxID=1804624 RepID=UPI0013DD977F|nr:Ig-like domain-containing protein [Nocardioides baekrokdamisoli]
MQKFARLVGLTNLAAVLAAAFLLATSGAPSVGGLTQAAYQGPASTAASISNAPSFKYGSCVPVRVAITSDAGTPTGTVKFSIDGVVVDTRALPSSGTFTEMVGCCGSRLSAPLSVGTHHFAVDFIPSGNWAPSHSTGQVVILANNGVHPVCGGTPTSGLPHGVDAGLSTFGTIAGVDVNTLRMIVSGIAVTLAMGVVAVYRRRRTAQPVRVRE